MTGGVFRQSLKLLPVDHLAVLAVAEAVVNSGRDRVVDELHRTVAKGHVEADGMRAAEVDVASSVSRLILHRFCVGGVWAGPRTALAACRCLQVKPRQPPGRSSGPRRFRPAAGSTGTMNELCYSWFWTTPIQDCICHGKISVAVHGCERL